MTTSDCPLVKRVDYLYIELQPQDKRKGECEGKGADNWQRQWVGVLILMVGFDFPTNFRYLDDFQSSAICKEYLDLYYDNHQKKKPIILGKVETPVLIYQAAELLSLLDLDVRNQNKNSSTK